MVDYFYKYFNKYFNKYVNRYANKYFNKYVNRYYNKYFNEYVKKYANKDFFYNFLTIEEKVLVTYDLILLMFAYNFVAKFGKFYYQVWFPDVVTMDMNSLIELHNYIFSMMLFVLVFLCIVYFELLKEFWYSIQVSSTLGSLAARIRIFNSLDSRYITKVLNFFDQRYLLLLRKQRSVDILNINLNRLQNFTHHVFLETVWTLFPIIIILMFISPSFSLLYSANEFFDKIPMKIKIIGNQWFWDYEVVPIYKVLLNSKNSTYFKDLMYGGYSGSQNVMYEIDLRKTSGLSRLLITDEPLVVPINTNIQLQVTASDVIHSFALPQAGIKIDAVPGRISVVNLKFSREGRFSGMCSELCGVGHSKMPFGFIVVSPEVYDSYRQSL